MIETYKNVYAWNELKHSIFLTIHQIFIILCLYWLIYSTLQEHFEKVIFVNPFECIFVNWSLPCAISHIARNWLRNTTELLSGLLLLQTQSNMYELVLEMNQRQSTVEHRVDQIELSLRSLQVSGILFIRIQ